MPLYEAFSYISEEKKQLPYWKGSEHASKMCVCKKLNSSYGENTALYIHRLIAEQVACHYIRHLVISVKEKSNYLIEKAASTQVR